MKYTFVNNPFPYDPVISEHKIVSGFDIGIEYDDGAYAAFLLHNDQAYYLFCGGTNSGTDEERLDWVREIVFKYGAGHAKVISEKYKIWE